MPLNRFAITAHQHRVTSPILFTPAPLEKPGQAKAEGILRRLLTPLEPISMSSREALELAAWLVVMAETNAHTSERVGHVEGWKEFGGVDVAAAVADNRAICDDVAGELAKLVDEIRNA